MWRLSGVFRLFTWSRPRWVRAAGRGCALSTGCLVACGMSYGSLSYLLQLGVRNWVSTAKPWVRSKAAALNDFGCLAFATQGISLQPGAGQNQLAKAAPHRAKLANASQLSHVSKTTSCPKKGKTCAPAQKVTMHIASILVGHGGRDPRTIPCMTLNTREVSNCRPSCQAGTAVCLAAASASAGSCLDPLHGKQR